MTDQETLALRRDGARPVFSVGRLHFAMVAGINAERDAQHELTTGVRIPSPQIASGTMSIVPHGHSAAHSPQPLQ